MLRYIMLLYIADVSIGMAKNCFKTTKNNMKFFVLNCFKTRTCHPSVSILFIYLGIKKINGKKNLFSPVNLLSIFSRKKFLQKQGFLLLQVPVGVGFLPERTFWIL